MNIKEKKNVREHMWICMIKENVFNLINSNKIPQSCFWSIKETTRTKSYKAKKAAVVEDVLQRRQQI